MHWLCHVTLLLLMAASGHAENRHLRQDWWHLQSNHFTVITNTDEEHADELIADLELFRSVVLKITNTPDPEERTPTTAILFRTIKDFTRVTGATRLLGYTRPSLRRNYMVSAGDTGYFYQRFREDTQANGKGTGQVPDPKDEARSEDSPGSLSSNRTGFKTADE